MHSVFLFFFDPQRLRPARENAAKARRLAATMLAPVGVSRKYEATAPIRKQPTEIAAAVTMTARKLLHTRMAESAGKMIRLEMSSAPIMRMPRTTVIAVSTARSVL